MNDHDDLRWDLGALPFLWMPLPAPQNPGGLPDTLPFTLGVDRRTGAFVQAPNASVSAALARAYAIGSMITGQMDEAGIGRGYADDFLAFMGGAAGATRFANKRVLEIGCGNGYLLHRLAALGATVIGLEPGEHGQAKYDVPVVRDFFPSPHVRGPFDAVVMFGVLEHIEAPVAFLESVFPLVAPGGEVLLAVPDCQPYLKGGDVSCLIHEHWSYFDAQSLARTLRAAGGVDLEISAGRFGGMLYARVARIARATRTGAAPADVTEEGESPRMPAFRARAKAAIRAIAEYIDAAQIAGETVGVFVPGRIVNTLFAGRIHADHCRFFDDNPLLKGTFFPGLSIDVEDSASLFARPTDRVLVMSRSFSDVIANKLAAALPPRVKITTWHELFTSASS